MACRSFCSHSAAVKRLIRGIRYSALGTTPADERDALRFVVFRDDGSLLTMTAELQPQQPVGMHVQHTETESRDQERESCRDNKPERAYTTADPATAASQLDAVQEAHRHAKALESAVLFAELDSLGLSELQTLAVKTGAISPPYERSGVGTALSREKLTALLLQQGGGTELLAALQRETQRHVESAAGSRKVEPLIAAPAPQHCRPCADEGGSRSAAGTVCGRWSANATHVFVAWKGCGVHVLQPLAQRAEHSPVRRPPPRFLSFDCVRLSLPLFDCVRI